MNENKQFEQIRLVMFASTHCGKHYIKTIRKLHKLPLKGFLPEELPQKLFDRYPDLHREYLRTNTKDNFAFPTIWLYRKIYFPEVAKLQKKYYFDIVGLNRVILCSKTYLPEEFLMLPAYSSPQNAYTGWYIPLNDLAIGDGFSKKVNFAKKLVKLESKRVDVPHDLGKYDFTLLSKIEKSIERTIKYRGSEELTESAIVSGAISDLADDIIKDNDALFDKTTNNLQRKYYEILEKYNIPTFAQGSRYLEDLRVKLPNSKK